MFERFHDENLLLDHLFVDRRQLFGVVELDGKRKAVNLYNETNIKQESNRARGGRTTHRRAIDGRAAAAAANAFEQRRVLQRVDVDRVRLCNRSTFVNDVAASTKTKSRPNARLGAWCA